MFLSKLFSKHKEASSSTTKKDTDGAMAEISTLHNDPSQKLSESVAETECETENKTFITCIGGSYSGSEIYFDHSSKKLVGHHYVWHIDDWQEYTGWFDETLEDVLRAVLDEVRFGYKIDKTLEILYKFFGSEVDDVIKRIEKENEKQ